MSEFYTPSSEAREHYKDISICIAVPHTEYTSNNDWNAHTLNMVAYSWMHGLKIYQVAYTERQVVHWARNQLANIIRSSNCPYTGKQYTHILWLDDDHVFNPDLALWLAQYHEKDMVSALYYGREGRVLPVVYTKEGVDDKADTYKHSPIVQPPQGLFECDAVGFGALLMRLDVLDRFPHPWFQMQEGNVSFGEDIHFCVKAKQAGVRVWCDSRYKIGHVSGRKEIITEKHYREYLEKHKAEMGENILVKFNTQ